MTQLKQPAGTPPVYQPPPTTSKWEPENRPLHRLLDVADALWLARDRFTVQARLLDQAGKDRFSEPSQQCWLRYINVCRAIVRHEDKATNSLVLESFDYPGMSRLDAEDLGGPLVINQIHSEALAYAVRHKWDTSACTNLSECHQWMNIAYHDPNQNMRDPYALDDNQHLEQWESHLPWKATTENRDRFRTSLQRWKDEYRAYQHFMSQYCGHENSIRSRLIHRFIEGGEAAPLAIVHRINLLAKKFRPIADETDPDPLIDLITVTTEVNKEQVPNFSQVSTTKKTRLNKDEREARIRNWLETNKKLAKTDPHSIMCQRVADEIGASYGATYNSAPWQAFIQKRDKVYPKGKPREVSLTDEMLAVIPSTKSRDDEIDAIVQDGKRDEAEQEKRHNRSRYAAKS